MKRMIYSLVGVSVLALSAPAQAQGHQAMTMPQHVHHHAPTPAQSDDAGHTPAAPHTGHAPAAPSVSGPVPQHEPAKTPADPVEHSAMGHHREPAADGHAAAMRGALGTYPASREASGTAWQPDASRHQGRMQMAGYWMLMGHATLNLVADHQGGPRGDDKRFASGMAMGMAQRPLGNGTLQLRAMVSPDPLMGKRGYPLLLASGETADGKTHLVDRQHPHDFFMELSGSVSQPVSRTASLFVYGGLPGEPAFGPPAFMHREAIMDSPEAPISHHWLDSTHISFGVVTGGAIAGPAKIELSRFNGREPDQYRWNIETGPLDSSAVRLSLNPSQNWSVQASWGRLRHSEQLHPDENQTRWSASALYAADVGRGHVAATLAWGRKVHDGHALDAWIAEAGYARGRWALFARGEKTRNDELLHGVEADVGKASLGAVYDVPVAGSVKVGVGALGAVNFVPGALKPVYGRHPLGSMAFLQLKIG